MTLDHTILRVRDARASLQYYQQILGFRYEGRSGPFEVLRVDAALTLDLLEQAPKDPVHLAFSLSAAEFTAVHGRLQSEGVAFGGDVFERDGRISRNGFGARGLAQALYFYDPDQHNIEIRTYDSLE